MQAGIGAIAGIASVGRRGIGDACLLGRGSIPSTPIPRRRGHNGTRVLEMAAR